LRVIFTSRRLPPVAGLLVAGLLASASADAEARPRDEDAGGHFRTGHRIAEALAISTGVPISPLLGVSALGAARWLATPESQRPALVWFARPAFWGTGLFLAFLFAANTTLGALVPGLKKPMDFVEQWENPASALLASPVVVIEVHRLLAGPGGGATELVSAGHLPLADAGLAAITAVAGLDAPWSALVAFGSAALALTVFFVVFVAFHAVQVLIALSPSTILDLLLRGFRLAILATSGMALAVHPYLGAAYGLLLLGAAALVSGWAFRLGVFGSVFAWDLLRGRAPAAAELEEPLAFSGRGAAGVPVRSCGRIEAAENGWRFRWRPWLILPARGVPLPRPFALRRGALSPSIFLPDGLREPMLARLPPRFRGHESALAAALGSVELHDGRLVRGLRAAWSWLCDLALGREGASEPAP
jgi:hypothetical protein